jgi:hypothetical protein
VHQGGEKIAVKMLYDMPELDNEQFQNDNGIETRTKEMRGPS